MSGRKSKIRKPPAKSSSILASTDDHLDIPPQNAKYFPFARYTSIVGVHTTLLMFTVLFLPRTPAVLELTRSLVDAGQLTSKDRPQHPFLEDLTSNPASTVASISAGAVMLQGWWGGWVREWWLDYVLDGSSNERRLEKVKINQSKLKNLLNAWTATFVASVVIYVVLVLFGAPLGSQILHTYVLAALLSILTVFPPAYTLGVPSFFSNTESLLVRLTWVRLFAELKIRTPVERALVYPAVGTCIGSWLGAIPIALDWDRPWQAWPLTPAFGAVLGYILGSTVALTESATKVLADDYVRSAQSDKQKAD